MNEHEPTLDLEEINQGIADRSDVFYWQTDRAVEPVVAGQIWADRHRYFTDDELVGRANELLDDKIASIEPLDLDAQTNLGNVNSVRTAWLQSGNEVIIRSHPKGIKNGYFHAEALASRTAKEMRLPAYVTLAIHDFTGGDDFAFQVMEKVKGTAVQKWLEAHPEDEDKMVIESGKMMARLHKLQVDGFGPFDNERAKRGELVGLHVSLAKACRAGLPFNLEVLGAEGLLTEEQQAAVTNLFTNDNPLLQTKQAVLVHNDFADWNILTDGQTITGLLDWDECVGGDPVSDIACWSTFFDPKRTAKFLEGYWQVAEKPADFDEKFELLRLRYIVSKMTLRLRRYSWQPTDAIKQKIETGRVHLAESLAYFHI